MTKANVVRTKIKIECSQVISIALKVFASSFISDTFG